MVKNTHSDTFFLGIVIAIVVTGIFMFISASFGVLAKNENEFFGVLFNQLVLGLIGGCIAMLITSKIPYLFWRSYAFYFFIGALLLTMLVFVPSLGFSHGGARRWLALGPVSLQPVECLKFAFIMYLAAWLSWVKHKFKDMKLSALPLLGLMLVMIVVLLKQPDTKSLILMFTTGPVLLFISGLPWKYLIGLFIVCVVGFLSLTFFVPYVRDRVHTFLNPTHDPQGSSYQLQQSLIAVGSGGVFGRGFGQSIQKFSYLPEPQGDSIFAVVGEEFGFVGASILVLLFVAFGLRGLRIAYRAPDAFSRLLVTGIVILIVTQSFLNIAAIIGVFPLTGVPLVFVSHGGTSLLISLAAVGIVLHISKHERTTKA